MLFEFRLRPVDEIAPWTQSKENLKHLHWHGLTAGYYRLKVGDEFLLNLSDAYFKNITQKNPRTPNSWMDYQVAQLWEDISTMLPHVLDPIPREVTDFLIQNNFSFTSWEKATLNWLESHGKVDCESKEYRTFALAGIWISHRALDVWYIRKDLRPGIWMWAHEDTITLSWDTDDIVENGIHVWSAPSGLFSMPRQMFLEEIHHFNDKLMSEMQQRVDAVSRGWNRPGIHLDIDGLQMDQVSRAGSLEIALSKSPVSEWFTNWDDVLEAMRIIKESSSI